MIEDSDYHPKGRPWTGRSVLVALLAFFAVMLGVNFYMARVAIKTFSGLDVTGPYDAGIAYNKEIDAAKAQNALGWTVDLTRIQDGPAIEVTATIKDKAGQPVSGLDASLHFFYPATRALDQDTIASAVAEGVYTGAAQLRRGHWDVQVDLKRNGERLFRSRNPLDIE